MSKQKQIKNLQKQINTLKKLQQPKKEEPKPVEPQSALAVQQHGKLPGLGQQFDEVGKTMGQLKDLIPKKKANPNPQQQLPDDPLVAMFRRWLLIGLTVLVGGGAAIMVVVKIIGRVFG